MTHPTYNTREHRKPHGYGFFITLVTVAPIYAAIAWFVL